ncbi:hypothetical protein [Lactococcus protaetiae]|uniref:hypothetical protein n=1 Tax=Lactococcus protaetiae TaxID=2592653 RepID=UPI001CC1F012|nr:hypothetical protein [Lactococcus protaetiae]
MNLQEKINLHLEKIYTDSNLSVAKSLFADLISKTNLQKNVEKVSEQTTYLITYGDSFREGRARRWRFCVML